MSLNRYPGLDHSYISAGPLVQGMVKKLRRNGQENMLYINNLTGCVSNFLRTHRALTYNIGRVANVIGQKEFTFKTKVETEVVNAKCLNFPILSTYTAHLHT